MAAGCGVAGGAFVDIVRLVKSVRHHGRLPTSDLLVDSLAELIRLVISGTLAVVAESAYSSGQSPLTSFLVGMAGLSALTQIGRLIPRVAGKEEEASRPARSKAREATAGSEAEAQVHGGLIQLFLALGPPPDRVHRPAADTLTPSDSDSMAGPDLFSRSGRGRTS